MKRQRHLAGILALCAVTGCATPRPDSFAFLGIPETEAGDKGPVGLVNGAPCRIRTVSAVSETTYQEYQAARQAGRVFAAETHGGHVYYAVKNQRDVHFDNASARVEVIDRFKTKKP